MDPIAQASKLWRVAYLPTEKAFTPMAWRGSAARGRRHRSVMTAPIMVRVRVRIRFGWCRETPEE